MRKPHALARDPEGTAVVLEDDTVRAEQKGVTIAMIRGEPTLVFRRVQDLREALKAADDMGLPFTSPRCVTDRILGLLLPHLVDDEGET